MGFKKLTKADILNKLVIHILSSIDELRCCNTADDFMIGKGTLNDQPSERIPLNTGWRMVPFSVSCMKCAAPTSSGFIQTMFL